MQTRERSIAMKEIRAKKFKAVNGKTLIATVDISKATQMGYYRCPDGTEVRPFEFANNGRGFNKFWHTITKAKESHNLDDIVVGFESTGSYGEPLMHYLRPWPLRSRR